jgi:hypothetical protein
MLHPQSKNLVVLYDEANQEKDKIARIEIVAQFDSLPITLIMCKAENFKVTSDLLSSKGYQAIKVIAPYKDDYCLKEAVFLLGLGSLLINHLDSQKVWAFWLGALGMGTGLFLDRYYSQLSFEYV